MPSDVRLRRVKVVMPREGSALAGMRPADQKIAR
jgi:hypothetical protein